MATSGVISTNTKYGSCFWVKWGISGSQSIAGNKTTIAWSCGLTPGEQYYTNAIKMSAVSIAGVKVYDGGTYSDIKDYKDRTFASGTLELSHNADGTKSFTVAAFSGWLYGNGDYTAAAKSFTLPTIPRATTPAIGPVTIGGKATISLPRASASFTHTLTYTFGSASGTIATKAGSSYTWTVPESLAAQITSKLSGTGTLTCKTYKGSTLVGTKSVSFTAAVPGSMKPDLGTGWAAVSYDNSGTKASAIAAWVQGYSKAKATFNSSKITCKQGATVKKYSITYLGKTVSASPYRTGTITATSAKVRCTVTDSRGLTAYEDFPITLLAYAKPALNGVKLYRSDAEGKAADSGTHIAGIATAKYSSLGGKNSVTIKGYWKAVGGSYGSGVAMQAGTAGIISGSAELSTEKSYTAKIVATDSLGNTAVYEATIPTEKVAFHLKEGGDGAAFGKISETAKALELAADWEFKGAKKVSAGGLDISGDSELGSHMNQMVTGNPWYGLNDGTNQWHLQASQDSNKLALGLTWDSSLKIDTNGNVTLPENLTGKYLTGTWLQATAATDLGKAPPYVCVFDAKGWLYKRKLSELFSDMGIPAQKDYVVERGTSSSWHYEKWNSGKLELWRQTTSSNLGTTGQINGWYYRAYTTALPSNLLKTIQDVQCNCVWGTGVSFASGSADAANFKAIYFSNQNGGAGTFWHRITGTWK